MNRQTLLIGLIAVLGHDSGSTQEIMDVRTSIGMALVSEDLKDGREYAPWMIAVGVARPIVRHQETLQLDALAELHFGDANTISGGKSDFDVALNLAAELRWQMIKSVDVEFSVGTGPGYQSSVSALQARGFVFSNNFVLGLRIFPLKHTISINPQLRFRHMSNARLKSPNSGLDNFFFLIGLAVPLNKTRQNT
jgi:hypothetical protein